MIGQETAKRSLSGALESDRVAQAYLFHGPEGVGKSRMAQVLMRRLVCRAPNRDGACGTCPDCRMFEAGTHPDVHRLQSPDDKSFGIDEVRRLQGVLSYTPYGRTHVSCVAPADRLTIQAANAFLKTLEEPPGKAVFILVSAYPERIPPTVLSRCVRIPFRRLSREEIIGSLERMGYMGPQIRTAAALAEGSLAKAVELVSGAWNPLVRDEMISLAGRARSLRTVDIADLGQEMGSRAVLEECLRTLVAWYRDLLMWLETAEEAVIVNADRLSEVRTAAEGYSARELVQIITKVENALQKLGANGNPRLIIEVLLLNLATLRSASFGAG
ncbi:MAG: DNA polymerase III subunit delta' [Clostridia bacterium]|nr:DNA polymerase III subunit delta' [Clostridia bacterium]MDQ7791833.1 DNA polymerase III subunit delta' [Clostridia bacterium]